MSVWDKAEKLDSAEGSVWDQAIALKEQPEFEEAPDEAYKTGIEIQDISVNQEIPINDIEENITEFKAWNNNKLFDPSEPPQVKVIQNFDYTPDIKFDKETVKRQGELKKQKISVLQDYFGIDPVTSQFREVEKEPKLDFYPPYIADPDEPPLENNVPTIQDIISSMSTEDIKYVINTSIGTNAFPDELNKMLNHEERVREYMENLKSHSEAKQTTIISGLTFTNLFNLPDWTSRKGIHPTERIGKGRKGDVNIANEAAARVLAEKNEISAVNVARIANLGANVLRVAIEFWLTPGAGTLSKVPTAVRPFVQTGIKFATHEALTAPRQGETLTQKGLSVTESFMLGFGVGASGKFIPKAQYRVPTIVGGFSALTYAKTGDIEASIETGFTVLGFEAVGLMQQAMQFTKAKTRNMFADKAIQKARLHNSELNKFSNKEVADILEKQARNFSDHTGRDISHKVAREEAQRAWAQAKQGDYTAWKALQMGRRGKLTEQTEGKPLTQPAVEATKEAKQTAQVATKPELGTKVPPKAKEGLTEGAEETFSYQDTKAEPLLQSLVEGAPAFEPVIEGSGDILREFALNEDKVGIIQASEGYINEKLRRIDRWLKGQEEGTGFEEESHSFAKKNATESLKKITEAYENQPTKTTGEEAARRLSVAIAKNDIETARRLYNFIKTNLTKLVEENTTKNGISKAIPQPAQAKEGLTDGKVGVKGVFDIEKPPVAEGQSISAVKMDDGTILFDTEARIHSDMLESLNIDPADIADGGFIVNGKYKSGSADIPRIAEQAKAQKKVVERLAKAELQGSKAMPKQVAEVAEKLPEATIAKPITAKEPVSIKGKTFHPVTLPTEKIGVDPKRFQFKLGAKLAGGVTEALQEVDKFDPVKAGQVLVWQNKAGKYFVVDGHHRVALAKKTGAESLNTWVIKESDGWTSADARATGALRNLADGKGTAIDAAKLFRDSDITIEKLKKQGVPTNNAIVKQGMDMKDLSDYVFRLVVDEKLPANFAAPIGRNVKSDAQQKQVADLILEGEVDTVRQAELLSVTIDSAPVLTTSEQTLFGLETTEKSLFAERAKVLANVEKKLKTNKKVFGVLAKQTGIIEAKGNVLKKVENLAAKEQAEEVLFMLEKLANAKGTVAEALNDATKEYAKNPTKENLTKVTNRLLEQWTEGPGKFRVPDGTGVQQLPLKGTGQKAVEEPDLFKSKQGGFVDVTPLAKVHETFMSIIEPSKAVEIAQGKDVYAEVIKGVHKADVAMIDFNEKQLEHMDRTLGEWGKALGKYSNKTLENLMLSRGKPSSKEGIEIQDKALSDLMKEAPELVGTRKMITRVGDFNYDYLSEVVGDQIGYVEDYFYGIYKDPRLVEKFLKHWKTTKRFTKQKKLPTVADAKAFGLDLRDSNPINNLRSEYMAIARLDGMISMKEALMKSGEGKYIDKTELAPIEWDEVKDPVFRDVRVAPELAEMINDLISTNKITQQPALDTLRQINNFSRTVKFIGSAFHLGVISKQALADSGYLGFLYKKTALRGFTTGFKQNDPIFKQEWYKKYVGLGGGHRYSLESEAQRAFSNSIDKINEALGVPGAGKVIEGAVMVGELPESFVKWMFESYIPKVKAMKYLDFVREQEIKLGRSLTDAEHIEIIKEGQNFYGMMNERLFGRSGTATTALRIPFMAPGFAEGNFRSRYKALLQWGVGSGHSGSRSRSNVVNSFIITIAAATVGTLILTGKSPKKPESKADIRDLFKVDTGKVDKNGNRIMIDLLTYDKDYWDFFGNLATLQPGKWIESDTKRIGGMKSTTWDVLSDFNQLLMGKAVYDWKGDRIVNVTDPFIEKTLKMSLHELKKGTPIATNVFQQARKKGVSITLSAAMTLAGVRLTKSEQDKREMEVLSHIFSLREQQEELYYFLGGTPNPRESIKKYNATVMRILDNPITTLEMKDEYESKLIIDEKRMTSNKVHGYLGDKARLAEYQRTPEKYQKEIKELKNDVQKSEKWLKNFEITPEQYKKELVTYEILHRKIIKEIQPEDDIDELKNDLANFYANQTLVKRRIQSGQETNQYKRLSQKYTKISSNISLIAQRIYNTENEETRISYFNRIKSVLKRSK